MRFTKTRSIAISLAGLAVAATGALAQPGAAHAAVPPIGGPIGGPILLPCPILIPTSPPTDLVKLTGIGVDFGTGGLDGNEPLCSGTVAWDISGGSTAPEVDGELYLKNSIGVTARVRAEYFDVHDTLIGSRNDTSHLALTNNETHVVSIAGYASPLAYRTDVVTQILVGGVWQEVDRESAYLSSSTKAPDPVTVTAVGQDFGTGGLVGGVPAAPGLVTWNLGGNTTVAELTGNLYMINSLGQTARMRLRTFDVQGNLLSARATVGQSPGSNALATFPVALNSLPNPLIYKAEVSIQLLVGVNWQTQGTPVTVLI